MADDGDPRLLAFLMTGTHAALFDCDVVWRWCGWWVCLMHVFVCIIGVAPACPGGDDDGG